MDSIVTVGVPGFLYLHANNIWMLNVVQNDFYCSSSYVYNTEDSNLAYEYFNVVRHIAYHVLGKILQQLLNKEFHT